MTEAGLIQGQLIPWPQVALKSAIPIHPKRPVPASEDPHHSQRTECRRGLEGGQTRVGPLDAWLAWVGGGIAGMDEFRMVDQPASMVWVVSHLARGQDLSPGRALGVRVLTPLVPTHLAMAACGARHLRGSAPPFD
jgi:hypothetical protein